MNDYIEETLRAEIRALADEVSDLKMQLAAPPRLAAAATALGEASPNGDPLCLNWNQVLTGIRALRARMDAGARRELIEGHDSMRTAASRVLEVVYSYVRDEVTADTWNEAAGRADEALDDLLDETPIPPTGIYGD